MAIIKTTTDQKGRVYKKVFSNFKQDAVVSTDKKNNAYSVKPNIAIRRGESKFNDQVVLQLVIENFIEEYKSRSQIDHLETYFKINEETIEFFEEFLKILKEEVTKK